MKKGIAILGALALCIFMSYNVQAASGDYTQTDNIIVIETTNVTEADDIEFQASAQVTIVGQSSATNYAHSSFHNQALGKKQGRQFGMAGDSAVIFWESTETGVVLASITATSSDVFTGWTKM